MNDKPSNRAHKRQKTYRHRQSSKGLVRFELQVSAGAKARFEALVTVAAEEYTEPWDPRRRLARARAQVFEDITHGVAHEFFTLKDQIETLKAEVKALSPQFFKPTGSNTTPLPEAIRALPDEPTLLKAQLAETHQAAQRAQREALNYQRLAKQFEALYETASNYNEELSARLESRK